MKRGLVRAADPYRDLDVIDSRAPRFNQATVGLLAALAVATGWWPIRAALGAQLAIGLTYGRRFCLPCLAYFELVQPRFGEGPLEDARPPRFANMVGVAVLTAATATYVLGAAVLGAVLGSLVAVLALLAATTGFCAGCEAYKLGCLLTGRPFVSCPLPPAPEALVREADGGGGLGEPGGSSSVPNSAPRTLEQVLQPARLAGALDVNGLAAATRPLRPHDPAEVDDLERDAETDRAEELRGHE